MTVNQKVLLIIPTLSKGGAERMVINMATALQKKGAEVKIILFKDEINYPINELHVEIVPIEIQLSILKKSCIRVAELQEKIDQFNPDIVHSHLFESEIALAFVNFAKNTKRIVHFHDNMVQMAHFSFKTLISKIALANLYERYFIIKNLKKVRTTLLSISKDSDNFARKNLGHLFPIFLVHNAIDLSQFKPNSSGKVPEPETFSCSTIGSFVDKKGQNLAIETIFELCKRNHFVKLYLVGDGVNKQRLENLVNQKNLSKYVEFIGKIDHPETILQKNTFYLHTASYEPFGLVIIEAMACGLPVVCTDGFGNRDLLIEGENGFLVKERNPKLLADKIQFLLERPHEIERMGREANRFAQNFGMENYIEKLIAVYNEATKSAKSE